MTESHVRVIKFKKKVKNNKFGLFYLFNLGFVIHAYDQMERFEYLWKL